ncbi:MAG TPA: hypothetical protein VGU65_14360 [Frateuria sp.]|uniref:hypothetical protein n=1 Tax=Frateuria sp. TaxID=2211372 RepID=UPI002DEACCC9|nr:hypothetical protein [Frateuria sp.]
MNRIDEETLQAYVDGELDPSATARIDAALGHDEELARRVREARAVRARLRDAFDPVLDEPVPERLSALLQPRGQRVRSGGGHRAEAMRRRGHRWRAASVALAASVVLAAAILWWWRTGSAMVRMQDGRAFAAGGLERALDHALASEPDARAAVAIGLSFRSSDGQVCRTFVLRTPPARAGLACRGDAGWSLPVLVPAARPQGGELRQAASGLSPQVQAAVDARLSGEVFDARQERAARDAGWR